MIKLKHLLAGALMFAIGSVAQSAPIEINIGHVLGENSNYQAGAKKFAEILQERVGDRVKVNIYPAATLGGEPKLVQGIRTGVVDSMIVGQPTLENTVQEYRIFSLPYLFDSYDQANKVLQGPAGDEFLGILGKYGIVGLGWGGIFERSLASMSSITNLDDAKGKKLRVIPSPGYVEAYNALGMQPTPIAYGELFLALQNGVVDMAELSPEAIYIDRFVDIIKYYSVLKIHQLPSLFIISERKFKSLPEDIQPIVKEAGREAMKHAAEYQTKMMANAFDIMREHKVTIEEPDIAPFMEQAKKSWNEILSSVPDSGTWMDKIEAAKSQ